MKFAFIDVDGTLIDKDDNVRPFVPELILGLNKLGYSITIWSAGGGMYAANKWNMICNRIFHTTGEYLYEEVKNFAWKLDWESEALIGEHFYVDDTESILEKVKSKGHKVYKVSFYEKSINQYDVDNELWLALKYIEAAKTSWVVPDSRKA